jgi:hypothetical protein
MKTFQKCAAQGDLYIRRINSIPKTAILQKAENGLYIVSHSETGHHHVVAERPNVTYFADAEDPMVSYMQVVEATEEMEAVVLKHLRDYDTHEDIGFAPGEFKLSRQRENAPEGWRRVMD